MQVATVNVFLTWLLLPLAASAAEVIGTVTLLEGGASLLRGSGRYVLAEGVRLEQGDVLELGDKTLSRVEFADGTIVDVGPQSRLLALSYPAAASGAGSGRGEIFLLRGWMKLSSTSQKSRAIGRYTSPLMELSSADATAVMQVAPADAAVFMESGEAQVAQVSGAGKVGDMVRLKASQYFSCKQGQRGVVAGRPSQGFLEGMPRSFMDTLPSRLAKFKERGVAPKLSGEFTYAEVQEWIDSVPSVRRALVIHWRGKAADPAFRKALVTGLKDHPEWDRVLNPEKYEHPNSAKGEQPWKPLNKATPATAGQGVGQ